MLKVKSLSLKVADFCLENISFEIARGETHVIIGKTGSGKTLLLETIIGLNAAQSGKISINNRDSTNLAIEERNIAYLAQDLTLFPHLNVEQNILYAPKVKGTIRENLAFSKKLIEATGIAHLLNREIKNLSGGEKQRVALVRALMSRSKLLLLDEPFSALDQNTKQSLRLVLKKLQQEFELSILSVTHDLEEAVFLADKISILSKGKILQTAEKKELYQNPVSAEVATFLGVNNIFDAVIEQLERDSILITCEAINTNIRLEKFSKNKNLSQGMQVKFAFGKSNITILTDENREKRPHKIENCIEAKVVLIIDKISSYEILAKVNKTQAKILIEIPNSIFNKKTVNLNQDLLFSLNLENVLVFKYQCKNN